nr:uncharacterized protein LOC118971312 [Manis javanica]
MTLGTARTRSPKARPGGRRAGKRTRRAWGTHRAGAAGRRGRGSRGGAWPGPRAGLRLRRGRWGRDGGGTGGGTGAGSSLLRTPGCPACAELGASDAASGPRAERVSSHLSPTSGRACPGSIRRMRTDEPGHLSHELRAPDSGRVSHPLDYLGPRRLGCHLTFLAWPRGPWCLCICASSLPSAGGGLSATAELHKVSPVPRRALVGHRQQPSTQPATQVMRPSRHEGRRRHTYMQRAWSVWSAGPELKAQLC